jgi:broad specificity polyphosphatase/5'/3'-nucleotidase SurE
MSTISGMNEGANLGTADMMTSETLAVAGEAAFFKKASIDRKAV